MSCYLIFLKVHDDIIANTNHFYANEHNELYLSCKKRLCDFRYYSNGKGFATYEDARHFLVLNFDWINRRFLLPKISIKKVDFYSTSLMSLSSVSSE